MPCVAVAFLIVSFIGHAAFSDVTFFADETLWQTAVGGDTQEFVFTANNVALADEVPSPPPVGSLLGPSLTFQADVTRTLFDFGFIDSSPDNGTQIIFTANGLGSTPTTHHDWSLLAGPANAPTAIGIEIFSNNTSLVDRITVFDVGGSVLASLPVGNAGGNTFIGVISDDPIGRILYDDNPTSGGQVLRRFVTVSIPEISATTFILTTAPLLVVIRRR